MHKNRCYFNRDEKFIPAHQLAASIIDLGVSRGIDKNRLVRGTGIFYQDIKNGHTHLSIAQLLCLMNNVQTLVASNDCAFQLGQRIFPGNYGHISNALLHSRHLHEALRILAMYRAQICPFLLADMYRDGDQVHLVITDAAGCGAQWRFVIETYFTALASALKFSLGRRIPLHLDFPYERPKYHEEYEANLGMRLNFSQNLLRIRIDRQHLFEAFIRHSPSLKLHALQQLKQSQAYSLSFLETVRNTIKRDRQQKLSDVAAQFHISPATLKRKLKKHHVGFQQIQDEISKQQAIYLLQIKKLNNEESANVMDFNDIPNFRRAVKRWTGLTPDQLRLN